MHNDISANASLESCQFNLSYCYTPLLSWSASPMSMFMCIDCNAVVEVLECVSNKWLHSSAWSQGTLFKTRCTDSRCGHVEENYASPIVPALKDKG